MLGHILCYLVEKIFLKMNNEKIVGLITVRTSSTRLPNKCLLKFGDFTVIEHIIKRAIYYNIDPIICTSIDKSDDVLEQIAKKEGVKCFRGSLENKLKRWADCATFYNIERFHTVDADDPFFDGAEIHKSMNLLITRNLDIVCPTISSSNGGASVGYSLTKNIINEALINVDENTDTEMMWYYIDKVQNLKKEILSELSIISKTQKRLTLDYEEDYWLLNSIQRILGNFCERDILEKFFNENPDFYKINWFRNTEWKSAQEAKKI